MIDLEKRWKHLTDDDREMIQNGLNMGMTFKAIAKRIRKDQTTVSKEVKKHIEVREARNRDGKAEAPCEKLIKAPSVYNGCRKTARCKQERWFYVARKAHEAYRTTLVEARTGLILNSEEFYDADRKLTEALKNGQHLYHALKATGVKMGTSSAYRYVQKGLYVLFQDRLASGCEVQTPQKSKKNHDLPRNRRKAIPTKSFLTIVRKKLFLLGLRLFCKCNSCPAFNQRIPISLMRRAGKIFVFFKFAVSFFWHPLHTNGALSSWLHGAAFSIRAGMAWMCFFTSFDMVVGSFPIRRAIALNVTPWNRQFCISVLSSNVRCLGLLLKSGMSFPPLCFFPD